MTETSEHDLEALMQAYSRTISQQQPNSDEAPIDLSPTDVKHEINNENQQTTDAVHSRKASLKPETDGNPVWNNEMVFMLIDQYKLFKPILDDKQHAKKPVWEKIAENLIGMGCVVTPVQCSQKWRNMMLQRRQRRQRQLLGLVSAKSVTQPWEEALEAVAPPIDIDQIAQMPVPTVPSDSPRHFLKRRRTEEAILKNLGSQENCNPALMSGPSASPSGSSDPEEPEPKAPRGFEPFLAAGFPHFFPQQMDNARMDQVFGILKEIQEQQGQFFHEQAERQRLAAERDERKIQLLHQFMALFAQAMRMFMALDRQQ